MRRSLAAALLLFARTSLGQVNTEVVRARALEKSQLVAFQGSFAARAGNVRSAALTADAFFGVRRARHLVFMQGSLNFTEVSGAAVVARAFGHARYGRELLPWLHLEVFGQTQSDRFQSLLVRSLVGMAARFVPISNQRTTVNLGAGFLFERELFNVDLRGAFPRQRLSPRWSALASWLLGISRTAELALTVYVQPRVDDFTNTRAYGEIALQSVVTDRVVAKMAMVVRHLSAAPPGVSTTDIDAASSLGVTF